MKFFQKWMLLIYRSIPVVREIIQIRTELKKMTGELIPVLKALYTVQSAQLFDVALKASPRYSDHQRLLHAGFQVCSQHQEDGMILEIFNRIGVRDKNFLEIGVGDGIENNTSFFASQGWSGYWVDADPLFVKKIESVEKMSEAIKWKISLVTRENINDILTELEVPVEFDLMSIDIDQNTFYIWSALDRYKPRVVVVEYNAALPPALNWRVDYDSSRMWDGSANFGASLKAFEALGREKGYSLVGCDFSGTNAFFVRNDLISEEMFSEPFTAENHYEPRRYSLVLAEGHRRGLMDRVESSGRQI